MEQDAIGINDHGMPRRKFLFPMMGSRFHPSKGWQRTDRYHYALFPSLQGIPVDR